MGWGIDDEAAVTAGPSDQSLEHGNTAASSTGFVLSTGTMESRHQLINDDPRGHPRINRARHISVAGLLGHRNGMFDQVGETPDGVGEVDCATTSREILVPVDERDRRTVATHGVVRTEVTVAHGLMAVCKR